MIHKDILFDLDGTLTDSGPGITRCAADTIRHYGLPVPDAATLRTMVGPPLRTTFPRFGIPEAQVEEAILYYRKLYNAGGKFENIPYPGIEDMLQKLKDDGHRLFIATSKPEHMSVDILEHFGLAHYFDRICGSLLDGVRDQKAEVIAYLLDSIGGGSNVVMVGDTVFDVVGAKEHGIPTIAVAWGYGKCSDMFSAGAVAVANTPEELYRLLSK
jgi:phosphoglycolate phosphatase